MSSSLTATLERINTLRKQAMGDPEFVAGAMEHTEAIEREQEAQSLNDKPRKKKPNKQKQVRYSSLYAHLNDKPQIY